MRIAVVFVFALVVSGTSVWAQADSAASPGPAAKVTLPPGPSQTTAAPAPANQVSPSAPSAPAPAPNPLPAAAAGPKDAKSASQSYIIGPLDVLYVRIWNLEKLSGPFSVGPDGTLSMPLVGAMKAEGLTTKQLTLVLTERLKECCVINPEGEVDIQLAKNNSKRYYVYGGVAKQGEFPLDRADLTVMDALASVGSFTNFANKKKIYVLRGTDRKYFNYEAFIKGKNPQQNIVIQNGDRIIVPE